VHDDVQPRFCSFCAEQGSAQRPLAGGLGAMICLPCVEDIRALVRPPASQPDQPAWERMSDAELLDTLPTIMRNADQVSDFAADWVRLLRERGVSWAAIGKSLGVSRQAVWERFSKRIAPVAEPDTVG
jgi:hypothetical protein